MEIVWAIGLVAVNAVWLALVVAGFPGIWLMIASAAGLAWWTWDGDAGCGMFGVGVLVVVVAIGVISEVLELIAGSAGAAKAGGTRRGSIGALIGGMVGALMATFLIAIPLVGTLIGACGGACIGAWLMELSGGRRMDAAVKSGVGAGVGRLVGTVLKLVFGIAVWVILAVAAFVG